MHKLECGGTSRGHVQCDLRALLHRVHCSRCKRRSLRCAVLRCELFVRVECLRALCERKVVNKQSTRRDDPRRAEARRSEARHVGNRVGAPRQLQVRVGGTARGTPRAEPSPSPSPRVIVHRANSTSILFSSILFYSASLFTRLHSAPRRSAAFRSAKLHSARYLTSLIDAIRNGRILLFLFSIPYYVQLYSTCTSCLYM